MPESTLTVFEKDSFNAEKYVKELVQDCVGGPELQQTKAKIQSHSDTVSSTLKKHVYENYMQFIETAKEISHLESEMYQLSHILIEQRNLLSTLRDESMLDDQKYIIEDQSVDPNVNEEQQNKKAIQLIKESLLGYKGNLDDKVFIYEGGLIELDTNDYRPICRIHLFLFNDVLVLAKVKHDKKLEFLTEYDTKKIAVINIKDLDGVNKNAINVITSDGARIFQCVNSASKLEWIDKFEVAIKFHQLKHKKGPAPQPPTSLKFDKQKSVDSDMLSPSASASVSIIVEKQAPDWLASAPEEIQAEIAQRHFEDSLTLVQKCEEHLARDSSFANAAEIGEKIKTLKTTLSSVLMQELSSSQSRSLQAALRSSRRPLKLLVEMGKAREACGILLRVCSTAIRTSQRQARRNNLAVSELFFCDVAQVSSEFLRAFSSKASCTSALIVWCNLELQYFASQLIKHYLTKDTQLEMVAKVVEGVREPCSKLTDIGLDLSYHMEGLLRNTLEQLLEEAKYRLVDSIGRTEDVWQPYNLQTKTNLRAVLKEFEGVGVDMQPLVTGDTWINLTQTTVNFCRHFLATAESCAHLAKYDSLKTDAELLLKELFLAQHAIKPHAAMNVDLNFVAKNKTYMSEVLLPIAIARFEKISDKKPDLLAELQLQLRGPPKPKPRSVYKTDVL
ncbi:exocyst complex-subunit protein, 84kD-subunit [Culex quinquefasciatus]|uniref:Exocyst complex component 8 n=1 Tax=Culex quinquefasciatus TaxID=7176 RepID=B0WU68_CULQU|nr:exocyst complex component 8 [Culex quinquefasciatus]EDS34788.1 exocyst complex-subunit protein, 84kD-subunit [Culex quinquefasciatus]|eukprot:XP_001857988.1 exocyst complex-subunit protein, 84kD-subunit [Culex quinquefasciatus]